MITAKTITSTFFFILSLFVFSEVGLLYNEANARCFDVLDEYVKITVYNPVKNQNDNNHLETADGSIINPRRLGKSVAISRDLESRFKMGDTITISCNCPFRGKYVINDKLGKKAKNQIDVLSWDKKGLYYGKIEKTVYE